MSDHLCITVRWLGDRFHGFTDDRAGPEWPPSPYRLFQALVAGAYQYGVYEQLRPALAWIERQQPPEILAEHQPKRSKGFDHYVPDNDYRLDHKKPVMRVIEPLLLTERSTVTYVWRIDSTDAPPVADIDHLCSTLSSFGCGVDQAFASARLSRIVEITWEDLDEAAQFRHIPSLRTAATRGTLRTPKQGSLDDLNRVFSLNRRNAMIRLERRKKRWPTVFDRYVYTGLEAMVPRPHAVFRLRHDNDDPARYPHAQLVHVAGMVRHLAIQRMSAAPPSWHKSDAEQWLNGFVRGKAENPAGAHARLSYVPLPSIGPQHADAMIRNIMLIAPVGCERDLEYVATRIDGELLQPEPQRQCAWEQHCRPPTFENVRLERFTPPRDRFIDTRYLGSSPVWETVTPIILDGHNDKKDAKTIKLIQLALERAGIETPCEFTWQSIPFLKNCLTAHKYDIDGRPTGYHRPQHLKDRTAVHVKLWFHDCTEQKRPIAVPGPITLGAGRHCGFGLMAAANEGSG